MSSEPRSGAAEHPGDRALSDPRGALAWRLIGPHRGGRVVAVAGHPTAAGLLFRACAGGVWKTTTAARTGRTSRTASSSAPRSARSPSRTSDPNVIYVGMGETTHPRQRLARRRRLQVDRRRARPGRTCGLRGHAPHRQDPRPPDATPTWSTSRRSATPTARTRSAASSARATAARPGSRCCFRSEQRRRDRPRDGPAQPAHPLRRVLGGAALPVRA